MTEKRFQYIRNKYRHYIHDVEKDGEYQKGHRGTYDEFDLNEITNLLNVFNDENKQLKEEVNKLEDENKKLREDLEHCANQFTDDGKNLLLSLRDEMND